MINIQLQSRSSDDWLNACLHDFDSFLRDHAACERKASATAIQFVVRYPDRTALIQPMIRLAQEELSHFRDVMRLLESREITGGPDEKNPYVNEILKLIRNGRDTEFLDRMLCIGIIEARGAERFERIGEGVQDEKLKDFYQRLSKAEAKHHILFTKLAHKFFPLEAVRSRLEELCKFESAILEKIPIRAAVH